ncbi:MAG: NAD(+)/NADH kinase [bacterium]|nr:NAD(+)/NADH kinase [bacterium]
MDKFCIITNNDKDKDYKVSNQIKAYLESQNKSCYIAKEASNHVNEYDPYIDADAVDDDTDVALVLGGDGTIIQAANDLVYKNIPLLGINLGTLGFMAEVEQGNMIPVFEKLFKDEYTINKRMMLRGNVLHYNTDSTIGYDGHALNDIVISKRGLCRIITVKVYVNDRLVDTYLCDGLVVSTPTGSTGYNLSAGGPIVSPEIEAIMITAICPHTLNNRCIMVSAKDKVVLELGKSKTTVNDEANVIFDGRLVQNIDSGDCIEICRAEEVTEIVKVTDTSFYEVVREKILKGRCEG